MHLLFRCSIPHLADKKTTLEHGLPTTSTQSFSKNRLKRGSLGGQEAGIQLPQQLGEARVEHLPWQPPVAARGEAAPNQHRVVDVRQDLHAHRATALASEGWEHTPRNPQSIIGLSI